MNSPLSNTSILIFNILKTCVPNLHYYLYQYTLSITIYHNRKHFLQIKTIVDIYIASANKETKKKFSNKNLICEHDGIKLLLRKIM